MDEAQDADDFDRALAAAGLAPDPQDRAAALKVHRYLARASEALRQAEGGADDPG
jgi:hypothetical protein